MAASAASSVARVIGRYVLHSELASGGMATVHLGRVRGEAGFTRTVAIKRLHRQFAKDPDFVNMFVDEARLAARIRHPNVVPTLDVISDGAGEGAEIFLVMEYVAGESLSRLLRTLQAKKRLISPRIAMTILSGVLHGLHAAHEAHNEKGEPLGIVHRDVSPQNVLVGTDGLAHVLDFGVAKATGRLHGITREGELKGKLAYMAPEQFEIGALTRQSDVYAAAVVLWETLTLRRLFEGDSEGALLMQVMGAKIEPPSTIVPGLPEGLDAIVMRGLARDPAKRWATARDFAVALEKCAAIAPASEIGEWVQSIAGDVLSKRAGLVAEIEGGSLSLRAVPASDAPKSPGEVVSQVSTIALTSEDPVEPFVPPPRGGKNYFLAGALAGLLVVILLLAFRHNPSAAASQAGAAEPPQGAAQAVAAPVVTAPSIPTPAPPSTGIALADPTPSAAGNGGSASTTGAADPKPADAHPTAGWAPRPAPAAAVRPAAAKTRPDCDPPFSRDALGHKHFKVQCL